MQFRYQDKKGKVHTLADVASLLQAIRVGAVAPDTPLVVGNDRVWHPASAVTAYREAVAALRRSGSSLALAPVPSVSIAVSAPSPSRHGRRVALVLVGLLAVGFTGFRVHQMSARASGVRRAAAAPGPAIGVRAAVSEFDAEFGDSLARAQRRLHDWVRGQRFDVRFRGISLQEPASLRTSLVAAERYRMEIKGIESAMRRLSVAMLARADSLEGTANGLDGLTGAVDELMASWRRDVEAWTEIQLGIAGSLYQVAEYLLAKQKSYVVREGRPVFLSRDDGARFRELSLGPSQWAMREQSWANTVADRRSRWLGRIPAEAHPDFGRAVLPGKQL
jgi:hypothetical protein